MAQAQPVALQVRVPLDQPLTGRLSRAYWRLFVILFVLPVIALIDRTLLSIGKPASIGEFSLSLAAALPCAQQESLFYRNARRLNRTVPDVIRPLGMSVDLRTSV